MRRRRALARGGRRSYLIAPLGRTRNPMPRRHCSPSAAVVTNRRNHNEETTATRPKEAGCRRRRTRTGPGAQTAMVPTTGEAFFSR